MSCPNTTPRRLPLTARDRHLVAAVRALREAERRLDALIAAGGHEQNRYGDLASLEGYAWQASRAAGDLEMNYASPAASFTLNVEEYREMGLPVDAMARELQSADR